MSLTAVRSYFRTRLDALSFKEWKDGFNYENIPSNILDKSYHIMSGSVSGLSNNQTAQEVEQSVTIRVFFKGYRDPATGIDNAVTDAETIIKSCVKASNRLTGLLKNVKFNSMGISEIAISNDNAIMIEIEFTAFTILSTQ